jgi:hypothetical protein
MGSEILVAVLLSFTATLASAVIAGFSERFRGSKSAHLELTQPTNDPVKDSRLNELRGALARQKKVASLNGMADSYLTFGQYIVGGVLASSFIQESFSSQVTGAFGILVLLSSLIRQRYRPDIKAVGAKRRIVSLRSFIREVEDNLYTLNTAQEDALSIYAIRQKVTAQLSKFEESELVDVQESIDAQKDSDEVNTG